MSRRAKGEGGVRPFASRALGVSCARGRGRVCFCDGARSSGGRAGPQAQRAVAMEDQLAAQVMGVKLYALQ